MVNIIRSKQDEVAMNVFGASVLSANTFVDYINRSVSVSMLCLLQTQNLIPLLASKQAQEENY